MVGYPHEPRMETGFPRIVAGKALESLQQRVLSGLLGFFWRWNQATHHPQYLSGIAVSNLAEERRLSFEDALYE